MQKNNIEVRGINDPYRHAAANGWQIVNASTLTDDLVLDVDVAIVGSGSGGGTAAETLSAAGLKCAILEEGMLKSSDRFNMVEREGFTDLYQEGGLRRTKDGGVLTVQGRNVGGGTTVNWCSTFRTPEPTLNYWHQEFGLKGCLPDDMQPYFEAMEARLKVSKWPAPPNLNNEILKRGAGKLGYSWDYIPRNVAACWDLGYCGIGCPVDAKQSMLVTTIPAALQQGATLIYRTDVRQIIHDGNKASGVHAFARSADGTTRTGQAIRINARHTILAGGAINTPGILLRSGVPDPHKRIGKRTFIHPVTNSFGEFDEPIDPYYGAPQSIYSDHFTWINGVTGPAGYKIEVIPLLPGTFAAVFGGHGEALINSIKRLPNIQGMMSFLRDGFNSDSRGGTVELAEEETPVLDYPINAYLQDGIRRSLHSMMELQFAAGAKAVRAAHVDANWHKSLKSATQELDTLVMTPGKIGLSSAHLMGGCAMGADERCVVDHAGRFRFLENLSVFDGSIFPTSLGANPQMSIFGFVKKFASKLAADLNSDTSTQQDFYHEQNA